MEVSLVLNISKEDFFDFLYASIVKDIKDSSGKTLAKNKLVKGYSYEKNIKNHKGKLLHMKVTIEELDPCKEYRARIKTKDGENIMSYIIEDLENEKIKVRYREEYLPPTRLKGIKFKFLNLFHEKTLKKQARSNLIDIETYIKNSRVKG